MGWIQTYGTHAVTEALVVTGVAGKRHLAAGEIEERLSLLHAMHARVRLLAEAVRLVLGKEEPSSVVPDAMREGMSGAGARGHAALQSRLGAGGRGQSLRGASPGAKICRWRGPVARVRAPAGDGAVIKESA